MPIIFFSSVICTCNMYSVQLLCIVLHLVHLWSLWMYIVLILPLIIACVNPISDCYGLRPYLYGLGYPREPSPWVIVNQWSAIMSYPGWVSFYFCQCKIQTTIYINVPELSQGWDNSGGRVVSPWQVGQPWQAGQLFDMASVTKSLH